MNNIVLVGRLTKAPEAHSYAGNSHASFTIAVDRDFAKEGQQTTDFIKIDVWGKAADNCIKYWDKGSLVAVNGSLRIDIVEDNHGQTVRFTKVLASRVKFLSSSNKSKTDNANIEPQFEIVDDGEIPF